MAQLQFREKPESDLGSLDIRHPVQQVQCRDRWTGSCLNQECWAFQNINGDYYCSKDMLPANHRY